MKPVLWSLLIASPTVNCNHNTREDLSILERLEDQDKYFYISGEQTIVSTQEISVEQPVS